MELVVAVSGVVGGVAAAVALGNVCWKRETLRVVRRLKAAAAATEAGVFSYKELEGLPAPVASYLKFAIPQGQPVVRGSHIEHAGKFRVGGADAAWLPFTSWQDVTTSPPGFVWDAAIRIASLVAVRVRDSYLDGSGAMLGKLASLWPVLTARASPALDTGALHRYLAEAVWCPTALLPSSGVRWTAVDDTTALATLTDRHTTVSLQFTFNATSEVTRVYTAERCRDVGGQSVPTPWAGYHRNYRRVGGMMVPTEGEAEWILPGGRLPYWRGEIREIEFQTRPH